MTKRILVLDADKDFVQRLSEGLSKVDTFIVSQAANLQEAGNIVSRDNQDLAFIPVGRDARAVHALRSLQPDLRLVLTKPTTQYRVPDAFSGQVQGVLIKPLLEIDLPTVLQTALAQPVLREPSRGLRPNGSGTRVDQVLDTAVIVSILQQGELGQLVQAAVFSQGSRLLAHWGELEETEVATVALQAGSDWEQAPSTVQIQFVPLQPRFDELLLYMQVVADDYLLTLVAAPETPLREMRLRANRLVGLLQEALHGRVTLAADKAVVDTGMLGRRKSYAIVWRPLRPLPSSLHIPLRRTLERLAAANACVITHISVKEQLVHMVVLCPPGRDSDWAAYLFKNGSEATIQQEFGVRTSLWEKGYYATESAEPLTLAELNIFLSSQ